MATKRLQQTKNPNTKRIIGYEAIAYAERTGRPLHKYADPIEGHLDGLTPEQARVIASEDPSLIYVFAPRAKKAASPKRKKTLREQAALLRQCIRNC